MRRRQHAGADRLREPERATRVDRALREEPIGMRAAGHREPEFRFAVDHGVSAGDDAAALSDLVDRALHQALERLE